MKSRLSMVAALALAGCATSQHQFEPVGKNVRTATGQVRYEGHGRSVIGDLLVARSGESGRVEFGKGAGVTLMRVLSDGTHMRFEGPLARGAREFSRGSKLPGHLVIWSQLAERPVTAGTGSFANEGEKITYQLSLLH